MFGEDGNDFLSGDAGDDIMFGDNGNDTIIGGLGNDALSGGDNDDQLFGEAGDDLLSGGAGIDEIIGGAGNDIASGGAGDDTLVGGRGNDLFIFEDLGGHDTVSDFTARRSGSDTIDISAFGFSSWADVLAVATYERSAGGTTLQLDADDSVLLMGVQLKDLDSANFIL